MTVRFVRPMCISSTSVARVDQLVDQLRTNVVQLPPSERPMRKCSASLEHERISKARADRDRVTKAELERELFLTGCASSGEQSKAARIIGVTEGALRHWRDQSMTRSLPPRSAIKALRDHREKNSTQRRVAG